MLIDPWQLDVGDVINIKTCEFYDIATLEQARQAAKHPHHLVVIDALEGRFIGYVEPQQGMDRKEWRRNISIQLRALRWEAEHGDRCHGIECR